MKTIIKTSLTLFFALALSFQAFASGNNETVREIVVKGTDSMQFDVTLIEATPGETIRLTLETKSSMPKAAMAHNIAIVDLGVNVEEFVLASMAEPDNEYIAPSYEGRVIANTKMIGGGETSTIEFKVPETPGDYEYVCTFPGHYFGGMRGILKVSAAI
jgi:azurin